MAKLTELKVAELRRELEERDEDTTGTKSVLQSRLKQVLQAAGEDPDNYYFETSNSDLCKMMEQNTNKLEEKLLESSRSMEIKLEEKFLENSNKLKEELLENSNKLEEKFLENSNKMEEKLLENSKSIQQKLDALEESSRSMESKLKEELQENSNKLKEELLENSRTVREEVLETTKQLLEEQLTTVTERLRTVESRLLTASEPENQKDEHQDESKFQDDSTEAISPVPMLKRQDLPTFDGKVALEEYLTLFETAAMVNGWPAKTKAAMLSLSLRGDALRVLQAIPLRERQNYNELKKQLEMRFGQGHMEQVYRSQLRNRCQKPNETLQEFEADIARLVKLAYPSISDDIYESLAVDKFLDGLREVETQQAVKLARPRTLNEALAQALEFEAVKQSVRSHAVDP